MKKISKKILYLLVLAGAASLYIGILSLAPKEQGSIKGLNLIAQVDIYSDKYGIPHIDAQNSSDAYKALGYIMARDRLFQMDLLRRTVQGRLSEVFGKKTLEADKLLRTLQFKKNAIEILRYNQYEIQPEIRLSMRSFLEGIHYYMENNPLPIEFHLLNYKPEPFDEADIVGLSGYMALTFAESLIYDVLYSKLNEILPENKMRIMSDRDHKDKTIFDNHLDLFPSLDDLVLKGIDELKEVVPLFYGSNSWVLGAQRSKSGYPILANDPHIKISNPHIFYEAHIRTPDFEIYGNHVPLVPFAVMGHTRDSGWTLTMAELDDLNIYEEQINFDENKIMYKNQWVDLESQIEIIKIKGEEDLSHTVYQTPHGPLLNGTKHQYSEKNISLSWSVFLKENNVLSTFYLLPRAQSIEEFKAAIKYATSPSLNISWAHKDGDIAWWAMGKYPKFKPSVNTRRILNGWDGSADVEQYYSFEENPHEVNPASGVIVTANYKPWGKEFRHFKGYWQPSGRFHRIHKLLAKQDKWGLEELKKIQTDNTLPTLKFFKNKYLALINKSKLSAHEKRILKIFIEWDGKHQEDSIGASIFNMWSQQIIKNVFEDEMGKKNFKSFTKLAEYWNVYKKVLADLDQSFWDNIQTTTIENASMIITDSFKGMIAILSHDLGSNIQNWQWGKIHKISFTHSLGKVFPLNLVFNKENIPMPGGRYLINNLGHNKSSGNFKIVHGPATRRLIDFSDPENSFGVIPSGNSGRLFSEHRFDQIELFRNNLYRPQLMNWDLIKKLKALKLEN